MRSPHAVLHVAFLSCFIACEGSTSATPTAGGGGDGPAGAAVAVEDASRQSEVTEESVPRTTDDGHPLDSGAVLAHPEDVPDAGRNAEGHGLGIETDAASRGVGGEGGSGGKSGMAGGVAAPAMGGGAGGQITGGAGGSTPVANDAAVSRGLIAEYAFRETDGDLVKDTSGRGEPLDLAMFRTEFIDRLPHGVRFRRPPPAAESPEPDQTTPIIRSAGASDKINDLIRAADAFSLEVWMKPSEAEQSGPGRVVSVDYTNYDRTNLNFMHGPSKCGDHGLGKFLQIRIGGKGNACPALPVPKAENVTSALQYVVLTQNGDEWVLYSDGEVNMQGSDARTPAGWNTDAGLALGNLLYLPEPGAAHGNFRQWAGDLFYVAFYDVALTEQEVQANAAIPYEQR